MTDKRRTKPGGRTLFIRRFYIIFAFVLLFVLSGCKEEPETDEEDISHILTPYEGLVQVSDGAGNLMWTDLIEDLPVSDLGSTQFVRDSGIDDRYITYTGDEYEALRGIDVSVHQGDIDWDAVKSDGVEFAMIRVGYRGYSQGSVNIDETFHQNIHGATQAGIKVGVYFFSQAITPQEAREEAEFALEAIQGYDVTLPVAFDWEIIGGGEVARTDDLEGDVLTECALAFCEVVSDGGYEPAVYFYRRLGYYVYDLDAIKDLTFWVAAPGEYPDFYYKHAMWQYSFEGSISGIEGDVDQNLYFVRKNQAPQSQPAEDSQADEDQEEPEGD